MRYLLWVSIAAFVFLASCETVDTARGVVKLKGAKLADDVLLDAEWLICKKASIGSIKRKYGQTVDRANTYNDFCDGDGDSDVVAPR